MVLEIWFQQYFGVWGWLIALSIAIGINAPIFIWARWKKHLTLWACFLAVFFGISYWMMNPLFYILLFVFFISSSVLTKYRKQDKKIIEEKFAKGGERDSSQVLANGLAGFIFAFIHIFLYHFSNQPVLANAFLFAFITAIASVNADTRATEIGILSKDQPYWILNLREKVERGTSGGVSIKGTSAAFIGAFLVGLVSFIVEIFWKHPIIDNIPWQIYLFIPLATLLGFIGSLIDSLFGATIQGFFQCSICGKGTEKRMHCNNPTILIRGKYNFRNDHVNFWSSFIVGMISLGISCFAYLIK